MLFFCYLSPEEQTFMQIKWKYILFYNKLHLQYFLQNVSHCVQALPCYGNDFLPFQQLILWQKFYALMQKET